MMDNNTSTTPQLNKPTMFLVSRIVPLGMVVIFGALLVWNHYNTLNSGQAILWIILLAPLFFFLGVGGLIDPRIAWAIGPRAEHFPRKIKVIGGLLAVAGLVISACLALGVYHLQDPAANNPVGINQNSNAPG